MISEASASFSNRITVSGLALFLRGMVPPSTCSYLLHADNWMVFTRDSVHFVCRSARSIPRDWGSRRAPGSIHNLFMRNKHTEVVGCHLFTIAQENE